MRRICGLIVAVRMGLTCGIVVITDNAIRRQPHAPRQSGAADTVARNTGAGWEHAQVTATDAVVLKAWLFTPLKPNGSAVILLHGVGDTRLGRH